MRNDTATLSVDGLFTVFSFRNHTIKFRTSRHLLNYKNIKEWDNGYIVVTANYSTLGEVEEYIDLIPILKNLFFNPDEFLKPIKGVEIVNV